MKKFYAFAAVAMMAFAANAQDDAPTFTPGDPLYITGDADEMKTAGTWWSAETPAEFVYADGVYTIEINGLNSCKISTAKGDWDSFNAHALSVDGGDLTKDMLGVATALVPWGENTFLPWAGDYKIVVAGDLSTITATTTTPEPEQGDGTGIFLRGDMNGWGAPAEWEFAKSEWDNVYKFVTADGQSIKKGEAFKVADAAWAKINWCTEDMGMFTELEYTLNYNTSGNMGFDEEFTGIIWISLVAGAEKLEASNDVTFVPEEWPEISAVSEIEANDNAVATYYNLQGVRVANPENGLFIVVKGNKTSKVLVK